MHNRAMSNSLLQYARNPRRGLPPFDQIRADQVEPAVAELLPALIRDLEQLEEKLTISWHDVVERVSELAEPTSIAWGVVSHLLGVDNSDSLRQAHDAMQPQVVEAMLRLSQSAPLYRGLKQLASSGEFARLDEAQKRVVQAAIRDAELAGVGLQGEKRERFLSIERELAELATRFSNQLLDANKAFSLTLTAPDEVAGLPPTLLAATAEAARRASGSETAASPTTGPWRITLDAPVFGPFLEHSQRRDLREKLYRAYVTRASSGELDNAPLIERILQLRQEKAALLGFATFAEMSLRSKMAPSAAAVEKLLGELRHAALPKARAELGELTEFARQRSGDASLKLLHWDVPFWSERMREERYAYTDEELRPFFALPRVLEGLFATAERLFGIKVRAADGAAEVWNESVRFFKVADASGRDLAAFFLDPYSRPETKRGGAWMDSALSRKRFSDGSARLPVAYLVCNSTTPSDGRPSLMTFREVETLFHEFGHGLQHMLTTIDYAEAAGINNVEWDAVELPSQFMENWCYDEATIFKLARHFETGEALPQALFDKIKAARNYRAGSQTSRQVYLAALDWALHHRYLYEPDFAGSVQAVQKRVAADNTVLTPLEEDRFLCGFSHIFAGGYSAGYYSYKWAEVLSADAFSAFTEAGLEQENDIVKLGHRFRDTVLSLGGSRHPLQVFAAFRGREPSTRPLLEQSGLTK